MKRKNNWLNLSTNKCNVKAFTVAIFLKNGWNRKSETEQVPDFSI